MANIQRIPLAALALDLNNPRFEPQSSQINAIAIMVNSQADKLVNLAQDIIENGLNPSDLPYVMQETGEQSRFIVLEGNRRITALKILSTPEILSGIASPSLVQKFNRLGKHFEAERFEEIDCTVVADREEADHWIESKHTGENDGAGIVMWSGQETARYRSRRKAKLPANLRILDIVRTSGLISNEVKQRLPKLAITNLQRLIDDPYVRKCIGIDIVRNELLIDLTDLRTLRILSKIVKDLALKTINVSHIDNKGLRESYINDLVRAIDLSPMKETSEKGQGLPKEPNDKQDNKFTLGEKATNTDINSTEQVSNNSGAITKVNPGRSLPDSRKRPTLIPSKPPLRITDDRVNSIYKELRKLEVEHYPNAVAVLFRVFLELSLDVFIKRKTISLPNPRTNLKTKLDIVAKYLLNNGVMTVSEQQPINRALSEQRLLAVSITAYNAYVHNPDFSPIPSELKTTWDDLRPFFGHLWV